jgi:hypothetical protein
VGNPVVGNIVGNGNIPIVSGNNVQIPVQVPVDICATPWASWASPTPAASAAPRPCWTTAETSTAVYQAPGPRGPGAFCRDYPDRVDILPRLKVGDSSYPHPVKETSR